MSALQNSEGSFVPDPDGYEEDIDQELRHHLGLRPTWYPDAEVETLHGHPDPDPCPVWCWVARGNEDAYGHEMDPKKPFEAHHRLEPAPSIVASLYTGENVHITDEPSGTHTATIETNLHQDGGSDPCIAIALRRYRHRPGSGWDQEYLHKHLMLTLNDARELVIALNYVLDQAAMGES